VTDFPADGPAGKSVTDELVTNFNLDCSRVAGFLSTDRVDRDLGSHRLHIFKQGTPVQNHQLVLALDRREAECRGEDNINDQFEGCQY
jgi:hypothetical protein